MRGFHVYLVVTVAILLTISQAESAAEDPHVTNASKHHTLPRNLSGKTTTTTDVDISMDESSRDDEERALPLESLEKAVKTSTSKLRGAALKVRSQLWLKANKRPDRLFTTLKLSGLDDQQLLSSPVFLAWVKYVDAYTHKLGSLGMVDDIYRLLQGEKLGELQIASVFESLTKLSGYEKIGAKFQEYQFSSWYRSQLKPKDIWPHVKAEGMGGTMDAVMQRYAAQYMKYENARIKNAQIRNPVTRYVWVNKIKQD